MFEVLMIVNIKITVFWCVMSCNVAPPSNVKMDRTGSSEVLLPSYQTTRCHFSEDSNLDADR